MRFPLNFSSMLSRRREGRAVQQQSTDLSERQVDDNRSPKQIDTWCKSTSLTKNGDDIMFPNQGDTWHVGETQSFSWTGGLHIEDNQSQTFSLEIRAFGSDDDSEAVQIFANETFNYPSSSWQIWNEECADTYLSYNWTIPKDFDVGDTRFVANLLNTTDPENETTLTSNFFYIDSKPVDVSIEASIPSTSSIVPVVAAPSPAHETSTPAPNATIKAAATEETTAVVSNKGLSVHAKAGIGAGVGILGLMLVLAGFLFYYYKKRQSRGISEKGFVTPLEVNTARPRISEGGNSEMQRARAREMEDVPGSPLYRTDTERNSHRRSIRLVYEPNQDPIGLPADVSLWSPKTSQDGLNK